MHPEEFASAEVDPSGERIWIGSSAKALWAINPKDGRPIWRLNMPASVASKPLYVQPRGLVYAGSTDGCLYAIHADTGKLAWKYCTKGVIYEQPVYRLGVVYFANSSNYVYAVDAENGEWRWSYDRDPPEGFNIRGHSGVAIDGDRLYAGFSDGYLVCLEAASGDVNWTRSLAEEADEYVDVDATPVIDGGVLYVSSYAGGVYALTAELGAMKWRYPIKAASGVAVAGDRVYFASARKGLHCLDAEGKLLWRQEMDAGSPATPIVYHDTIVLATSKRGILFVERATGELLQRFDPGFGVTAQPTIFGARMFALDNGGNLFGLRLY
jgi:outer membrane protein assembly factor BamB